MKTPAAAVPAVRPFEKKSHCPKLPDSKCDARQRQEPDKEMEIVKILTVAQNELSLRPKSRITTNGGNDFREFQLQIVRMRIAFRQCLQRTLKRHGISVTFEMLQVLNCLWQEEGIAQQTLAERIVKDKACLTSLLANLEKKGYVYRQEGAEDRRNKMVFLTPEGAAARRRIRPMLSALYAEAEMAVGLENVQQMVSDLGIVYEILENE